MTLGLHSNRAPYLPVFGEPKWTPDGPSADERDGIDSGKKLKILVIDDEALIAETVVEILNQEGFDASAVSAGVSAIEVAKDLQPEVVLSDVVMPGVTGIDIGIAIREALPKCRIILFSGQAVTVDLLEKAREQGYQFDILAKPIKPEQLIAIIRAGYRA